MDYFSKKLVRLSYKARNFLFRSEPFASLPDISIQNAYAQELKSEMSLVAATNDIHERSVNPSWNKFLQDLRESVASKDILQFLKWPEVRTTMFYDAPLPEWNYLKKSSIWKMHRNVLAESAIGSPNPYIAYPSTSGNLVHHAYHIAQLMDKCGADISLMKNIVELGGGYGSMCRLIYHMGFKGNYTIFDLPEFLALQRYFLSMIGIYKKFSIGLKSNIADLDICKNPDLAIMTWSLSEMPVALRDELISRLGSPRYVLIAYQREFAGTDNKAYFDRLKERLPGYAWHEHEIMHMRGNYYLIGKRS